MFYENFEKICRRQGYSPSGVTNDLGYGRGIASGWKKNHTIPKEKQLIELADYLRCNVSDFFSEEDRLRYKTCEGSALEAFFAEAANSQDPDPPECELDENEQELLRIYRECSKKQRAKLMLLVYDFEEKELS